MTDMPQYWVEAQVAVKDYSRVIAYKVISKAGRETVHRFSTARKGGWEVALFLANKLRDDLNAGLDRDGEC